MRAIFLIDLLNIYPVRFIQVYDNFFDFGHLSTLIQQLPSFIPSNAYLRIQYQENFQYAQTSSMLLPNEIKFRLSNVLAIHCLMWLYLKRKYWNKAITAPVHLQLQLDSRRPIGRGGQPLAGKIVLTRSEVCVFRRI